MYYPWFKVDGLNSFVVWMMGVIFALVILYSFRFMRGKPRLIQYYSYLTLTFIASVAAALANNLVLLLACWGFLGFTLYMLINTRDEAAAVAKKALVIVGGADAVMILGIGILFYLTRTFQMDAMRIELKGGLQVMAYLCIAVGCFAKAGAMPFHTWIPGCAEKAPLPVAAFLPASLDKLLGIYLLARISLDIFAMNSSMNIVLMCVGAVTIIAGVMMALVQHNMKKLLGYHAVSQVGYMVLGIGTGNPIGIAGGLFHMLNNTLYKTCLFLTAGNVEYRKDTSELDKLGGLARRMPLTYISALIASLSISGVPPFNGFFSKWMVYQGLVTHLQASPYKVQVISVLCLVAAMFGSGLTLASFIKLIHAVFLGQKTAEIGERKVEEVTWTMWFPCIVLAALCVLCGVFAREIPLKFMIGPAVSGVAFLGSWYAGTATFLIILGLVIGVLIARFKVIKPALRQDASFIGGEPVVLEEHRVSGTEFYNTVREFGLLAGAYRWAERGFFDIYEQGKRLLSVNRVLQFLHNGVLPTYLAWILLGMAGLFLVLLK